MRSEVRAGRRKSVHAGWLRRRRSGVQGEQGPIKAGGGRARAGRTRNMPDMSVTVEVSKMLSDWSNDFAPCRVERRAYEAGVVCVVRRRRRFSGMHEEQGTRGAHLEHPAHVRDLGRIEAAKRLVERFRVLPSQRERAYEAERGTGRGRWKGEGTLVAAHKRCARRGGADSRLVGGQGASGAHLEHPGHVRDLGGVEAAERLVERRRGLPSRNERTCTCTYRCMHMHAHAQAHAHVNMCMCMHLHMCMRMSCHVQVHVHVHMCMCMCMCVCMCVCMCMCMCMCINRVFM